MEEKKTTSPTALLYFIWSRKDEVHDKQKIQRPPVSCHGSFPRLRLSIVWYRSVHFSALLLIVGWGGGGGGALSICSDGALCAMCMVYILTIPRSLVVVW
jgi:hypothetical protein